MFVYLRFSHAETEKLNYLKSSLIFIINIESSAMYLRIENYVEIIIIILFPLDGAFQIN